MNYQKWIYAINTFRNFSQNHKIADISMIYQTRSNFEHFTNKSAIADLFG